MLLELDKGIFVVGPNGPPRYPYGNCMYIADERSAVIDLGAGGEAFSSIDSSMVKAVMISHFHFDHTHGDALFPGAELFVGWQEEKAYTDENTYITLHGYELWNEMMPDTPRAPFRVVVPLPDDVIAKPGFRKFKIAGVFHDGEIIDLGRRSLRAVHLPGHTIGHYGFYLEKEGILFSGDMDLVASGPWYSSASADVGSLIESVQRIREIDPAIIVPSHRRILTRNIEESLDRYIQVVFNRQEAILARLDRPFTIEELRHFPLGFPEAANVYELFWEKMSIRNHILYLLQQGMIEEVEPGRYRRK